jgi:enoyl-CoA hydratase
VAEARALAAAPPAVYARAKAQLHRPALERISAGRDDDEVARIWAAEETLARLRAFLAAL